ncbi:MAG: CPBP family intramembrane metalloprotease [Caldilineaceae bacterium]|nr:CPBP family intramembrane metalloprotease [Caldilineaceae bacterium]
MHILSHPPLPASLEPVQNRSLRVLFEMLVVISVTLIGSLLWPQVKRLLAWLPIVYVLVERFLRRRSWAELGFQRQTFPSALARNWPFIVLVAVVFQVITVVVALTFWPALLDHVRARVPLFNVATIFPLLILLPFAVLGEELVYRAMFQERLRCFMGSAPAIVLASLVFALMHWSSGDALIVAWDLGFIFVDSLLYGVIFSRGKNIWVAWLAHWTADLVGLALLLFIV